MMKAETPNTLFVTVSESNEEEVELRAGLEDHEGESGLSCVRRGLGGV